MGEINDFFRSMFDIAPLDNRVLVVLIQNGLMEENWNIRPELLEAMEYGIAKAKKYNGDTIYYDSENHILDLSELGARLEVLKTLLTMRFAKGKGINPRHKDQIALVMGLTRPEIYQESRKNLLSLSSMKDADPASISWLHRLFETMHNPVMQLAAHTELTESP